MLTLSAFRMCPWSGVPRESPQHTTHLHNMTHSYLHHNMTHSYLHHMKGTLIVSDISVVMTPNLDRNGKDEWTNKTEGKLPAFIRFVQSIAVRWAKWKARCQMSGNRDQNGNSIGTVLTVGIWQLAVTTFWPLTTKLAIWQNLSYSRDVMHTGPLLLTRSFGHYLADQWSCIGSPLSLHVCFVCSNVDQ